MKFKQALMATSAAILLTAGTAVAQSSNPSSRPEPAPLTPSADAPGSASGGMRASGSTTNSASGGVTPGGGTGSDMSGSMSGSASLSAASLQEIKDDSTIISALDMNVKKLKGMDIVGSDGKKIGEVDKVLSDGSNQPKAVTVDAGGFLGIGSKEVIVPFDRLSKGAKDDELKTAMSKDELMNLTQYQAKRDAGPADGGVATGAGGQPATSVPPR